MVCFVITTNILLLSALIAILSQSLTKVRCLAPCHASLNAYEVVMFFLEAVYCFVRSQMPRGWLRRMEG
jgi:hypothetical protein